MSEMARFMRADMATAASGGQPPTAGVLVGWLPMLVAAAIALTPSIASAEPFGDERTKPPRTAISADSVVLRADLGARLNPQGAAFSTDVMVKHVYATDPEFGETGYLQSSVGLSVSPATFAATAQLEWLPVVFLQLRLRYDFNGYFGTNTQLLSFASGDEPFGDSITSARSDEESTIGHAFSFQPILRAKFGDFIIRNHLTLGWYSFDGTGPFFYEGGHDVLMKSGDFLLVNHAHVLWLAWKGQGDAMLVVGPFYDFARAQAARLERHRVGIDFLWIPFDAIDEPFRPRIYAQIGYNLKERNRQNELTFGIGIGADFPINK